MITDRLRGQQDKKTLSALSLVSQAWRAPAQMHLFEEIKIRLDVPLDAERFLQTFTTSSYLCSYILTLVVWRGSKFWSGISSISISKLLSLTALLPRLRTLSLAFYHVNMSDPESDSPSPISQSRHPLNLNILGCHFTGDTFIAILELFNVQSICIARSHPKGASTLR